MIFRVQIFRFPETVRVGKGEVEEEHSDNVFPATLSCRCVPHSCTTERLLGIFQSERLFSTHLGLRVFFSLNDPAINLRIPLLLAHFLVGQTVDPGRAKDFLHSGKTSRGKRDKTPERPTRSHDPEDGTRILRGGNQS